MESTPFGRRKYRMGNPIRIGTAWDPPCRPVVSTDGWKATVSVRPTWYVSPHLEMTGRYEYSRIRFPDRDAGLHAHLLRFRIGLALDTQASANIFVQYNSVRDALSSNIRLRYNFREGNDLWLVYNHGMNTSRRRFDPAPPLRTTDAAAEIHLYVPDIRADIRGRISGGRLRSGCRRASPRTRLVQPGPAGSVWRAARQRFGRRFRRLRQIFVRRCGCCIRSSGRFSSAGAAVASGSVGEFSSAGTAVVSDAVGRFSSAGTAVVSGSVGECSSASTSVVSGSVGGCSSAGTAVVSGGFMALRRRDEPVCDAQQRLVRETAQRFQRFFRGSAPPAFQSIHSSIPAS